MQFIQDLKKKLFYRKLRKLYQQSLYENQFKLRYNEGVMKMLNEMIKTYQDSIQQLEEQAKVEGADKKSIYDQKKSVEKQVAIMQGNQQNLFKTLVDLNQAVIEGEKVQQFLKTFKY